MTNKLQIDGGMLQKKSRSRKANKNENNNNESKYFKKLLTTLNDLCSRKGVKLSEEEKFKIINEIYSISEILESYSKKYLNTFYINLKSAIDVSNTLQKKKFEYLINLYFFDNLDNLFKYEINLKIKKEGEKKQREYEEYIERVEKLIIPKIKKIIQKRIDFIDEQKYKNCTEINILIDGEIECSEDRIESAKVYIENEKNIIKAKIRRTNNNEEKEITNSELKN